MVNNLKGLGKLDRSRMAALLKKAGGAITAKQPAGDAEPCVLLKSRRRIQPAGDAVKKLDSSGKSAALLLHNLSY